MGKVHDQQFSRFDFVMFCFFGLGILLTNARCNYRRDKVESLTGQIKEKWFERLNAQLLAPKCVGCHQPGNMGGQCDLTSYEKIMSAKAVVPFHPELSPLYMWIADDRMPKNPSKLSVNEKRIVKEWIEKGAPFDKNPAPPKVDPPKAEYAWINENIFRPLCVGCHSPRIRPPTTAGGKEKILPGRGGVDLTSYQALMKSDGNNYQPVVPGKANRSGLCITMREGTMPPRPKSEEGEFLDPGLPKEQIEAVCRWIDEGAKGDKSDKDRD